MHPLLWLPSVSPRAPARLRLVCFAHAGSGAATFFRWSRLLPDEVELCPIRLPGREHAIREPLVRQVAPLADGAVQALLTRPVLPTVILGHSFGSLLAYESARRLQAAGQTPELLIVSADNAPHLPDVKPQLKDLPDPLFLTELDIRYGGIPQELKAVPALLQMMLPILRADITASEDYRHSPGPRLRCPILACYGVEDRIVSRELMAPWAQHTERDFELLGFPGGHFYIYEPESEFMDVLRVRLRAHLP